MATERASGFYHVRTGNGWIVAEWLVNQWWLCADPQSERDCNFAEIDERRITRPSPAAAGVADEYRVLAGEIGKTLAPTLGWRQGAEAMRSAVLENIDQRTKWGQIQCGAETLADDIRALPLPLPGEPT